MNKKETTSKRPPSGSDDGLVDEMSDLVQLMMPGAVPKRRRGRPKVAFSVDLRRARLVSKTMKQLSEIGRNVTRSEVVVSLQKLAAEGSLPDEISGLFPIGDLTSSISRGMRELNSSQSLHAEAEKK